MTREENLHWLNVEIWTWENECQSKHPVKEALYAARKALEQEPILEKDGTLIVTTEHCKNVGRVLVQYGTNGTLFYQDQEPSKPMVEIDLYSVVKQKYIEREVLDKIRAEIIDEKDFAYADFERYKEAVLGAEPDELPDDDFRYGMERAIEIINKYTNDKCDKG